MTCHGIAQAIRNSCNRTVIRNFVCRRAKPFGPHWNQKMVKIPIQDREFRVKPGLVLQPLQFTLSLIPVNHSHSSAPSWLFSTLPAILRTPPPINFDIDSCTLDMSFPTFFDFDWQKVKSNTAIVFSPEEKVETDLFWYENKLYPQSNWLCGECGMQVHDISRVHP